MKHSALNAFIAIYGGVFEMLRHGANAADIVLRGSTLIQKLNLRERQELAVSNRDINGKNVVWLHAASLGEVKLLYKFLERLTARHPDDLYVLTAVSKTGVSYLEKYRTPEVCAVGFLPVDSPFLMNRMLKRFNISRVWILETEIWPSMQWCCMRRNIPVGIVNGRIERKSFSKLKALGFIFKPLISNLDIVMAQDKIYAQRFNALGVSSERIHVTGNLKACVAIRKPDPSQRMILRKVLNIDESAALITAGCVHPGEGIVIKECLDKLSEMGMPCKCIVVPRHMEASDSIAGELGGNVLRIKQPRTEKEWNVCLIEGFGILDDMYKIADAAVVGGTFVKIGGHNMWDPARFGIPVFFGPHTFAQNESCQKLTAAGVGFSVDNGETLAEAVFKLIKTDAAKFAGVQSIFAETINRHQAVLEPLIP
ncbi:MAG: hypothetical protein LBI42_09395 [Chitinispirillales bacterium]|jgi:3-deoxy-D-manno-octulosonic-acid transferase|nr:hypothetical protein [Chitinispirillales bacterium]